MTSPGNDTVIVYDRDKRVYEPSPYTIDDLAAGGGGGGGVVHGNGFPTSTPALGTEYVDDAQTSGAIKWIYTTHGWEVIYGDTGWRDVRSLTDTSVITDPLAQASYLIRRIGAEVRLAFSVVAFTTPGEQVKVLDNIAGFTSEATIIEPIFRDTGSVVYGNLGVYSTGYYVVRLAVGDYLSFGLNYWTADDWPASLPGTPV